ncbi:nucleotidyltransferase family protein [Prochlorococcus sp. MIT 1011]|uniref:nucleotidyltransferase family protein n=1 Tax=Prochlorococcus sp. MIT 1011 TaxID=3082520 RepID=UPI0039B6296A
MRSVNNLSQVIIREDFTVRDILVTLNNSLTGIVLIVDQNEVLIGTLTDGDIRRGLLKGFTLDSLASSIMNKNFVSITSEENIFKGIEKIQRSGGRQLPIVDKQGKILELKIIDSEYIRQSLPNPLVIMAGGKGKRLRPFTETCPKPMLRVGDKYMLEIILEQCIKNGFREFFFSVNYLKEKIIDYFQDGSKWNISIKYLIENNPLGTAGSLTLLPNTINETFVVLNCDVLTRFNPSKLLNFHRINEGMATICVRKHDFSVPFGVVENDGVKLKSFLEKPTYTKLVNAGIYALNPSILSYLEKNTKIDMPDLLMLALNHNQKIITCPIHEYWIDVGRPESLQEAINSWSKSSND